MRQFPFLILVLASLIVVGGSARADETSPDAAAEALTQVDRESCAELIENGEHENALVACREEFDEADPNAPAARQLAELEFRFGDSARSAELWDIVIELEGWSRPASSGKAMALWRAGDKAAAEAIFEQNLETAPEKGAYSDMISFYLAFGRWEEASAMAAKALEAYPEECGYAELGGVAEAGLANDVKAAELFSEAIEKGCPPYRWTTQGPVAMRLENEPYLTLLDPTKLAAGLRTADDRECELRLQLLWLVIIPEVAPQITEEVLQRDKLEIRFEGLGLLGRLGPEVMPSWKKLLADDDFVLRRYTLRRIREQSNPAYIPLLEGHLEVETSKGNIALTRLTIAEALLVEGEVERPEELVREIPSDEPLYAVGLTSLAEGAEARGDITQAVRFLDEALEADPEVFVDRERLSKLRAEVARLNSEESETPSEP